MEGRIKPEVPGMENFARLQYLITNVASKFLRQYFQDLWETLGNPEWKNTTEFGEKFTTGIGRVLFGRASKIQKAQLKQGNIEIWDVPLLIEAIKIISPKPFPPALERLQQVRNVVAHAGTVNMEKSTFQENWTKATKALVDLGMSTEEIETAGKISLQKMQEEEPPKESELQKVFIELKEKANDAFRKKDFQGALGIYSKGLLLMMANLSNDELALLYSNRSLTNAKLGRFEDAKDDAKSCITLRPMWFKSYARLAAAYEGMGKTEKALKNAEIAASLAPNMEELLNNRDALRHDVSKLNRKEHTDPQHALRSRASLDKEWKRTGKVMNFPLMSDMTEGLMAEHPSGLCAKGHKYFHGLDGVNIDYEIGANYFAQAAKMGNAEGLYNLAMLMQEGKGVTRDVAEGHRLLLQAASQPVAIDFVPGSGSGRMIRNLGVAEAQHAIGLAYENGVAVKANLKTAMEWYGKALDNDCSNSANNLGILWGNFGDFEKAFLYGKVAALKGNVRAMENLAVYYRNFCLPNEASKWLVCALYHESAILAVQKFPFEVTPEQIRAFNYEDFKKKLTQEILRSPLKHLAIRKDYDFDQIGKMISQIRGTGSKIPEEGMGSSGSSYKKQVTLIYREAVKFNKKQSPKYEARPGNLVPKADIELSGLEPIAFKDFDKKIDDKIYEGRAVKVLIVEDATVRTGGASTQLLAQDENGDVHLVFVYNYPNLQGAQDEIGFGCWITIVNPYFRKMNDGNWGIRIDHPNTIFKHPQMTDKKMCRFCCKPGGTVMCRKCRRVYYCSKACLKKDQEEFQHELVCFKKM